MGPFIVLKSDPRRTLSNSMSWHPEMGKTLPVSEPAWTVMREIEKRYNTWFEAAVTHLLRLDVPPSEIEVRKYNSMARTEIAVGGVVKHSFEIVFGPEKIEFKIEAPAIGPA
jgi:hypothetical protein